MEAKDVIGGFGPSEQFGIGVVPFDKRGDVRTEGGYTAIDAAPDLLVGEDVPTRFFGQPSPHHWGLLRDVILHNDGRRVGAVDSLDLVKELAELDGAVARVALTSDPSGRNIEGGEQRCGAVPRVVMAPRAAWPGHIGSIGWLRSSAWIWDFSSTHRAMTCSGG
ncbi:hypothetical protein ABIA85_009639 [Bradyrhizobium sp. LA6.10]